MSVLEAVKAIKCGNYEVKTLLICGGLMSDQNKQLAEGLGVSYIENPQPQKKSEIDSEMNVISYIISSLFMAFMVFVLVKGIVRFIRNDRGYRQMEADRKAKG